jgi:uncharacterized protein (DUF952 family)
VLIFKIVHVAEWRDAERAREYHGSEKDRADGFLHFSDAKQVPGTLAKYYAGMDDLVLVCVDSERLGTALKFEKSRDGALFPHLYGTLAISAVSWSVPIALRTDGTFDLPPELEAELQ